MSNLDTMDSYRNKFRQPLSNFRRWISDLGNPLNSSPKTYPTRGAFEEGDKGLERGHGESVLSPTIPDNYPNDNPSSSSPRIPEHETLENIKPSCDTLKVCSNTISKAQLKEFRDAFGFFDKDGDGFITTEELGVVMRSLGQFASEEELKEMLKEVDINGDGLFSLEEFVEIVSNYSGPTSGNTDEEQELRDAFRIFDKHSRGFISASDLRAVLHCLGEDLSEDEIEDMIKEVDVDGDGRIDFNEFVRALGEPDPEEVDNRVQGLNEEGSQNTF